MIRVHVHGASGRLGQAIVRIATATDEYLVSRSGRKNDLSSLVAECDVAIDVSQPEGSVTIAACCATHRKPLVIGTTGHSADQLQTLRAGAARVWPAPRFGKFLVSGGRITLGKSQFRVLEIDLPPFDVRGEAAGLGGGGRACAAHVTAPGPGDGGRVFQ